MLERTERDARLGPWQRRMRGRDRAFGARARRM